jgi:hypothetical protein
LKAEQKLRKNWETIAKIEAGVILSLLVLAIIGWII